MTIRIEPMLVDRIIYAIAVNPTDLGWAPELKARRANAPDEELEPIDAALDWSEHSFSHPHDVVTANHVGDGFARAHPDDPCMGAIIVDIAPSLRSDELVDTFARCFPKLARAHQYAGEKCRRMPDVPAEREVQLRECAKSFERCIQIDVHHPSCANDLSELQREWTAPYCTTASLTSKLRAEFPPLAGSWALDVADFAYAIDARRGVTLVLSERGRRRAAQWFAKVPQQFATLIVTTRSGTDGGQLERDAYVIELRSPTTEHVCDHVDRREAAGFP